MIRASHIPVTIIPIEGIIATTDRAVQFQFHDGRTPWLSRRHVDVLPGRVILPIWYFRKLNKQREVNSDNHG